MSNKKDLEQSYMLGEGNLYSLTRREEKTKYYYKSFSGLKGFELVDELKEACKEAVEQSIKLLGCKNC